MASKSRAVSSSVQENLKSRLQRSVQVDIRVDANAAHGTAAATYEKAELGDKYVVGKIIADYCMFVRDLLTVRGKGAISASEFTAQISAERNRLADVIAGKDPEFSGVPGWNDHLLGFRLRVELGQYWQKNRSANDGNPYRALFSWLCWAVFDAAQTAQGNFDLETEVMSNRTAKVIRILLGDRCALP